MKPGELMNTDKVVALAKQIGDLLQGKPYIEGIGALMVAMQCCIEDCIREDKQIDIASEIMGKIINGLVENRLNANKSLEYEFKKIVAGRGGGIAPSSLNEMEAEGWELAGQNDLEYIFRRKIK